MSKKPSDALGDQFFAFTTPWGAIRVHASSVKQDEAFMALAGRDDWQYLPPPQFALLKAAHDAQNAFVSLRTLGLTQSGPFVKSLQHKLSRMCGSKDAGPGILAVFRGGQVMLKTERASPVAHAEPVSARDTVMKEIFEVAARHLDPVELDLVYRTTLAPKASRQSLRSIAQATGRDEQALAQIFESATARIIPHVPAWYGRYASADAVATSKADLKTAFTLPLPSGQAIVGTETLAGTKRYFIHVENTATKHIVRDPVRIILTSYNVLRQMQGGQPVHVSAKSIHVTRDYLEALFGSKDARRLITLTQKGEFYAFSPGSSAPAGKLTP